MFVAEELPEEESRSTNVPTQTKSASESQPENSSTEASERELDPGPLGDHAGSTVGRKGSVVDHQQAMVDHRDVVQVTVKGILAEYQDLCEKAAALVFNISMAKVNVFKSGGLIYSTPQDTIFIYECHGTGVWYDTV